MGMFSVKLGVKNECDRGTEWVQAFVDTGALYTVLPASLLRNLVGIEPTRTMEFVLADESRKEYPVGEARLCVNGKEATSPVVFGESENQYLLGATTLQIFGLIADTTNERLAPLPAEYRYI